MLAQISGVPQLPYLVRRFLYEQMNPLHDPDNISPDQYPTFRGRVRVYTSATATYHAPSDHSGIKGMRRERIRSVGSWRGGGARRDCVFINNGNDTPGFCGLDAAQVLLLLSVRHEKVDYPCALVAGFSPVADSPDADTGMWIVEPDVEDKRTGRRGLQVIHLDCIVRLAHLIGVSGEDFIPRHLHHTDTYSAFNAYYVNKFADHHAHTLAY